MSQMLDGINIGWAVIEWNTVKMPPNHNATPKCHSITPPHVVIYWRKPCFAIVEFIVTKQ